MKKLIMFLMVLTISMPAIAGIEDTLPPMWGTEGPSATAIWQMDTDPTEGPTCSLTYFGYTAGAVFQNYWREDFQGEWNEEENTHYGPFTPKIEVPEGGNYVTLRIQLALTSSDPCLIPDLIPDPVEPKVYNTFPGDDPDDGEMLDPGEIFLSLGDAEVSGNVIAYQQTFSRDDYGSPIAAAGGYYPIDGGCTGVILDVLVHDEEEPPSAGPRVSECFTPSPIVIDPNESMVVHETDETESGFSVSLRNEPPVGATITITVDPNADGDGPNDDIILIGGDPCDGSITFTRTIADWNDVTMIVFKAINDDIPEPPGLSESQTILVSSSWPAHPTDANYVGVKNVPAYVMDNDQPNILFTVTPPGQNIPKTDITGPVPLWEEPGMWEMIRWKNIGVTLQVPPEGERPVKLQAELTGDIEGDNLPLTDPNLLPGTDNPHFILPFVEADDPNGMIFTAGNYNVSQNITIWGNDDDVLQAEGASFAGDENYQAVLVFTVVDDGGDDRYADMVQEVDFEIEDNECGAFGIVPMDVSNSFYMTDPNYVEGDPDCHVDLYDVIAFARQWLDCSDPQDAACESYL